jgi:hypothetical protein
MSEHAKLFAAPPEPALEASRTSDRRGRELRLAARPLLVLTRFGANKQLTKNKGHRVTPFWHNDTPARVTVTFGRRRIVPRAESGVPNHCCISRWTMAASPSKFSVRMPFARTARANALSGGSRLNKIDQIEIHLIEARHREFDP